MNESKATGAPSLPARLDAACPALAARPRVRLGHAPTPIDTAARLGDALGIDLLIKRDDCTGLAFGGNKVRQLEYYLGEAQATQSDTVLITSAVQSNFVRTAAAAARHLGMDIHIQLEERVPDPDEAYRRSGNVLLDRLLGATLHSYPEGEDEAGADAALEDLAAKLRGEGRSPYVVHLGIDHPPVGGLGYVVCAAEIIEQLEAQGQSVDAIVIATGSGLTHAGTLVGLRALGIDVPVYGICVRRDAVAQRARIERRSAEIAALVGRPDLALDEHVRVDDTSLAPGYGQLSDHVFEALDMAARLEGLFLDPVYTAKTMAGLIRMTRDGTLARDARVLFVHTGGQPALFGYAGKLEPRLSD